MEALQGEVEGELPRIQCHQPSYTSLHPSTPRQATPELSENELDHHGHCGHARSRRRPTPGHRESGAQHTFVSWDPAMWPPAGESRLSRRLAARAHPSRLCHSSLCATFSAPLVGQSRPQTRMAAPPICLGTGAAPPIKLGSTCYADELGVHSQSTPVASLPQAAADRQHIDQWSCFKVPEEGRVKLLKKGQVERAKIATTLLNEKMLSHAGKP